MTINTLDRVTSEAMAFHQWMVLVASNATGPPSVTSSNQAMLGCDESDLGFDDDDDDDDARTIGEMEPADHDPFPAHEKE